MNITQFAKKHNRLIYGPFPIKALTKIKGVEVQVEPTEDPFKDIIFLTVTHKENIFVILDILDKYIEQLLNRQQLTKLN